MKTVETNLALPVAITHDRDGLHTSNLTTGNGDFTKMKATILSNVLVTGDKAIVRNGSRCKISQVTHDQWLILECNGKSTEPMSLFLQCGRDFSIVNSLDAVPFGC